MIGSTVFQSLSLIGPFLNHSVSSNVKPFKSGWINVFNILMITYTTPTGYVGNTVERNSPSTKPPKTIIPDDSVIFPDPNSNVPDAEYIKAHFFEEGKLSEAQVLRIVGAGIELLSSEPNLLEIETPATIVGDIHGQYYDLIKMFQIARIEPPQETFLFLGDYVDRGYFSIECFLYLLALKLNYPKRVYLLRGNHECRHLTKHFTFRLECNYKYSLDVYETIMKAFDALPLSAIVNKQFFCVHGGISPEMKFVKEINAFNRFREPPKSGLFCDLLWSDPTQDYCISELKTAPLFQASTRGCSYRFSFRAVKEFLERNELLCIVRGHEAQDLGYRLYSKLPESDFPSLMTIFSAPNYVDVYKNKAAIVQYDGETFNIRQFTHASHPFYLPKFIDAFDWSLPFLSEKIADLLVLTLNIPNMKSKLSGLTAEDNAKLEQLKKFRERVIKSKIMAVNKVSKMFHTIRNEREAIDELMNVMGTRIVPHKYLTLGSQEIRELVKTFTDAKQSDCINEMMPPSDEDTSDTSDACSVSPIIEPEEPPIIIPELGGPILSSEPAHKKGKIDN